MTDPCTLQDSVGRVEECPGATCPFWDEKAVMCIFHPVNSEPLRSPALAAHLLELRQRLDRARLDGGDEETVSLFYRLLDDEPAA